jgi:Tfp pilus assembly major pilin PilA
MKKYLYSNGVSLIELLVIIAIIGIFATIGTQGYQSIVTGSDFISKKTEFFQYLSDIRFRAFSENKHYRIHIVNNDNNADIELYETKIDNLKWRDIDLIRRCAWRADNGSEFDECKDTFCNANINPKILIEPALTQVDIRTINKLNFKRCTNNACASQWVDAQGLKTINICYLFDGTIALSEDDNDKLFLEIASTSDNTSVVINTIHKTGYVE